MGWLSVLLSGIAAYLLFASGHTILMIVAITTAAGSLWSWGIMHNYATNAAKHRSDYTGGFYDFTNNPVDCWNRLQNSRIKAKIKSLQF